MSNPFDQFDIPAQRANPFDQFDEPRKADFADFQPARERARNLFAQLRDPYAAPAPASENASPSIWNRVMSALSTPQSEKDAFNARDPRLAQAAQWQGTDPVSLGRQNEASAGEFLKGIPVASAAVPQTEEMTKYEQEHPTGAAMWKGAGRLAAIAPVMAAAPEVLGAGAGQGLIARTLAGAGSNAAIEGGDTYANTGDVNKSLKEARNAALTAGIATPLMSVAGCGRPDASGWRKVSLEQGRASYAWSNARWRRTTHGKRRRERSLHGPGN